MCQVGWWCWVIVCVFGGVKWEGGGGAWVVDVGWVGCGGGLVLDVLVCVCFVFDVFACVLCVLDGVDGLCWMEL